MRKSHGETLESLMIFSSTILDEVVFMYTLQYIKFMNFAKISIFNQISKTYINFMNFAKISIFLEIDVRISEPYQTLNKTLLLVENKGHNLGIKFVWKP